MTTFDAPEEKKSFENMVRKGENADDQRFHLFLQCFYPRKTNMLCVTFNLTSLNAFIWDMAKILLSASLWAFQRSCC